MAKSKKKLSSKAEKKKPALQRFTRSSLIAVSPEIAIPATIEVVFTGGIGQLTAALFRKGVLINMQSISTSGSINFSDVQARDSVAVNGICAGDASVTLTVPSDPATPEEFSKEIIMTGFTIL